MELQSRFSSYLQQLLPQAVAQRYVLAISGGLDSVVLAHLFLNAGLHFTMAHVNFGLRGEESDADEAYVRQLAETWHIPLDVSRLAAGQLAAQYEGSIQMAARTHRYQWFQQLRQQHEAAYIVTAHHLNDHVETMLINQQRGTGLAGLVGIQALDHETHIIRPLLFATKTELKQYAEFHQITWREDRSNESNHYTRNFIRHQVIPPLQKLNEHFLHTMERNGKRAQEAKTLVQAFVDQIRVSVYKEPAQGAPYYDLNSIVDAVINATFILELLNKYQFNYQQACTIAEAIKQGSSGQTFGDGTHILLLSRKCLIPQTQTDSAIYHIELREDGSQPLGANASLSWQAIPKSDSLWIGTDLSTAHLDNDLLKRTLVVRHWQEGDFIYPLGMQGKKLLSDFFVDAKWNPIQKKQVWLLCDGSEVIWLIGHRINHRYRITDRTNQVLKLVFNP